MLNMLLSSTKAVYIQSSSRLKQRAHWETTYISLFFLYLSLSKFCIVL